MEPPLNNGFPCVYLAGYVERALERATSPGQSKSLVPGLGRTIPNVPCSWGSLESHPGQDSGNDSQEVLSTPGAKDNGIISKPGQSDNAYEPKTRALCPIKARARTPKISLRPSRCFPLSLFLANLYSPKVFGGLGWRTVAINRSACWHRDLVACGAPPPAEPQNPGALHSGDLILDFGVAD